ncbi:MAG: apolipoprotein N-acyltransferase [Planctomycetota bacterium]
MTSMKPGLVLTLTAVLCLCAAAPPGWFPGAGLLVLPGWMAFYALIETHKRRLLAAYLIGVVHLLAFSYSLVHMFWLAYVPIALVGGLYYLLAVAWTRALGRFVPAALAFGLALCGTTWLRCYMPGIYYPHAQPAHCLYHWPWLLGSVRWGSEVLANLLLGTLAAGIVNLYRAWRLARPPFRSAAWWLLGAAISWLVLTLVPPPGHSPGTGRTLRVVAIEPGFNAKYVQEQRGVAAMLAAIRAVMVQPTLRVAGPGAATPPDLVVWPESIALQALEKLPGNNLLPRLVGPDPPLRLHADSQLLVGTNLFVSAERIRVAALLLDAAGRYHGHHEKLYLVPGGETQPWFLRWLAPIIRAVMGIQDLPDYVEPGEYQRLLFTKGGTHFAAMICYDNAFPDVCRDYAFRGAEFFVVLSNECWYLGGAELDQMVAMTVFRALETGRPVIRCTVNGATLGVDGDGRLLGRLAAPAHDHGPARLLDLQVPLAAGGSAPMATWLWWLHVLLPYLVLATALALGHPLMRSWGRLWVRGPDRG